MISTLGEGMRAISKFEKVFRMWERVREDPHCQSLSGWLPRLRKVQRERDTHRPRNPPHPTHQHSWTLRVVPTFENAHQMVISAQTDALTLPVLLYPQSALFPLTFSGRKQTFQIIRVSGECLKIYVLRNLQHSSIRENWNYILWTVNWYYYIAGRKVMFGADSVSSLGQNWMLYRITVVLQKSEE